MLILHSWSSAKNGRDGGISGFSLAEALITLLIISIIVVTSTVMLAKNKRTEKKGYEQNKWICRLDESGTHKVESGVAGTGDGHGSYCEFIPPRNVSQFNVTVVGGGGGGASGTASSNSRVLTSGTSNFIPPVTGNYYIVLVGGGGGGGGKNCGKDSSQGGGSGGVIVHQAELRSDTTYVMTVGEGAGGSDGSHSGKTGNTSSFIGGNLALYANGGKGGYAKNRGWGCKKRGGRGEGGTYSGGTGYNGRPSTGSESHATAPGYVCTSSGSCLGNIERFLGTQYSSYLLGRGGAGVPYKTDGKGAAGNRGIVMVVYSPVFSGEGGHSGSQSFFVYKRNPGKTKVIVGKGGKGAQLENMGGERGIASRFGERVIADGGDAGLPKYDTAALTGENTTAKGGNGGPTPVQATGIIEIASQFALGGFNVGNNVADGLKAKDIPGGGGGGGGATSGSWGKGGDGGDGIVIVTW